VAAKTPHEVEIKFRVDDLALLRRSLRKLGFRELTPRLHEFNTLYDFPDRQLRLRRELLRIRHYGDSWILTHKSRGPKGRHKRRVEIETTVADGTALAQIFAILGMEESFIYEKYRSEWSDSHGYVVLDEMPIGQFAEIEGRPAWIDKVARKLGVQRRQYITASYAGLFLEWKRRTGSTARNMSFKEIPKRLRYGAKKPAKKRSRRK